MSNKKILLVVEGLRDDPRFMTKLISTYRDIKDTSIFPFGTNIHVLYDSMFTSDDEDMMDVVSALKERADDENRLILSQRFTDVFLIFDLDPHDTKYNSERIKRMLNYFNDSTTNGKLYINYPMLESYKHMSKPWDNDYLKSVISVDKLKDYKKIVESASPYELKNLNGYDKEIFDMIIEMNLKKANGLLNGEVSMPNAETYLSKDGTDIFDKQNEKIEKEQQLFILNTCVFNIVDYNPRLFLKD